MTQKKVALITVGSVAVAVLLGITVGLLQRHRAPAPPPTVTGACITETLAAAAGSTCTRGGVTFQYGNDPYAATGPAPGPSTIAVVMDSNGSNATLIGNQQSFTGGWSVGAGQVWSFTVTYTITGQTGKFSLAQLGATATGDGLVTATQSAKGISSTITCTAAAPCQTPSSGAYAQYTPATQATAATVTLTLNGGTNGSASISQLSQHWQ